MEQEELERWEADGGAISIKETMAVGLRQQETMGSKMGTRNKALLQEASAQEALTDAPNSGMVGSTLA